ncbi:MAG: DNA methyltransferase [Chitinophagales bacterium]
MNKKSAAQKAGAMDRRTQVKTQKGLLWTSRQRQAARLHEIAYRACFKPALPAYFISRYTQEGDTVYDPFSGRGTTVIEAALSGRKIITNDVNPISSILIKGRLAFPEKDAIAERLQKSSPARQTWSNMIFPCSFTKRPCWN